MPRISRLCASLMVAVLSVAARAESDPIQLGGFVQTLNAQAVEYTLTGSGFSLHGTAGDFGDIGSCYGMPCFAGTPIKVDLLLGGTIGGGSGTIGGTFYPTLTIGGNLQFSGTGSFTGDGATVVMTTPFSLFHSSLNATPPGSEEFALNTPVIGQGLATLTLHADPSFGVPGAYTFTSLRYEFSNTAITPEPASMLLLGSGVGLAALARVRRRKRAGG